MTEKNTIIFRGRMLYIRPLVVYTYNRSIDLSQYEVKKEEEI